MPCAWLTATRPGGRTTVAVTGSISWACCRSFRPAQPFGAPRGPAGNRGGPSRQRCAHAGGTRPVAVALEMRTVCHGSLATPPEVSPHRSVCIAGRASRLPQKITLSQPNQCQRPRLAREVKYVAFWYTLLQGLDREHGKAAADHGEAGCPGPAARRLPRRSRPAEGPVSPAAKKTRRTRARRTRGRRRRRTRADARHRWDGWRRSAP